MALTRIEQLIKITQLIKTIPAEMEKHFCSKNPKCSVECTGEKGNADGSRNMANCPLFGKSDEDIATELNTDYNVARILGRITD
ncbi:hypothetical protein [Pantoea eucrina]|uniref:hypothetical protein n=1 Tax=Pantoea eucrina TaxID=472693 RepID=UPI00080F4611|nr:hypothetical protein [Pantoea eucrina]